MLIRMGNRCEGQRVCGGQVRNRKAIKINIDRNISSSTERGVKADNGEQSRTAVALITFYLVW